MAKAMKHKSHQAFLMCLLFVFLLCSHSVSARLLPQKQGEKEIKGNGETLAVQEDLLTDMKEDFSNLMGSSEECDDKDEECLKRRMIAEAHLDYIYTQHHKPKP